MNAEKREQIRHALRNLAQAQAATIEFMEKTLALLSEELAIDPLTFWRSHIARPAAPPHDLLVDQELLSVTYQGRSCFLGNTLLFRFFAHLARRPNLYFSHDELLSAVWQGVRSDDAIRSVVKRLRIALRQAGMPDLAEAIDGSVAGHYALKIDV